MYRAIMMIAMAVAILGGAAAPQSEFSTKKVRQIDFSEPSTIVGNDNTASYYTDPSQQQLLSAHISGYPEYPPKSLRTEQPGYDGHMVAIPPPKNSWTSNIYSSLAPFSNYALALISRTGEYIWNFAILLFIGGILMTTICTFTPFCTITLLGFGLTKDQVREQVTDLARAYMTPNRLNSLTVFAQEAIDNYFKDYFKVQQHEKVENDRAKINKRTERRRRR